MISSVAEPLLPLKDDVRERDCSSDCDCDCEVVTLELKDNVLLLDGSSVAEKAVCEMLWVIVVLAESDQLVVYDFVLEPLTSSEGVPAERETDVVRCSEMEFSLRDSELEGDTETDMDTESVRLCSSV